MRNIFIGLAAIILTAVLAVAGWYYRPWSPFSPASAAALDNPEAFETIFQQMDELLPHKRIQADPEAIPLPLALREAPETFPFQGEDKPILDWITESDTTGIVVLHRGEIVSEQYFHGAEEASRMTSWSMAKSVVATLIAIAMEEGRIASLDQTVEMFAPQYAGSDYGSTTLRHLLMMSSGMDFQEIYSETRESDIRPFFFNAFILGRDVDAMAAEITRNREPGQDLDYISPNSHVLSAVLRGVYNKPIAEITEEKLWGPLGMTHEASWLQNRNDDRGLALGYCCLNASVRDYARIGQFYLQDGVWEGERLLPEGWVEQATRPNAPFQEPANSPYPGRGYALHFWIPEDKSGEYQGGYRPGEYFLAGVYGQYVWVDEDRDIVIARTAGDPDWGGRTAETFAVMRTLAEHYGGPLEQGPEASDSEGSDTEPPEDEEPGDE